MLMLTFCDITSAANAAGSNRVIASPGGIRNVPVPGQRIAAPTCRIGSRSLAAR
jgi:hypothetical protein